MEFLKRRQKANRGAKRGNSRWTEAVDFKGVWIVSVPEELTALDGFLWRTKSCKVRRAGGGGLGRVTVFLLLYVS